MFSYFRRSKTNPTAELNVPIEEVDIQPEVITIKNYDHSILGKFDTNPDFKNVIEKSLELLTEELKDPVKMDGKLLNELYADYSRVRGEIEKFERLVTEFKKLREEKKQLSEQLKKQTEEHAAACKTYEQKIQELTPERPLQESIDNAVAEVTKQYESEKIAMTAEIETLRKEVKELQMSITNKDEQNKEFKKRIEFLSIGLAKYKRTVDSYLAVNHRDEDIIEVPTKIDLAFIFSTKCGSNICEFLHVKQILKIRQVSKFFALAIRNRGDYSLVLAKNEMKLCARNKAAYIRDIELYKKRVGELDDDYSKHCFTKYVWLREKAADYMPPLLATAESLFKIEKSDLEPRKSTSQSNEEKKGDQEETVWSYMKSKIMKKDDKPGSVQSIFVKEFENNPRCIFIHTNAFKFKAEARRAFFDAVKQAIDEYYICISKKITTFLEKDNKEFFCQLLSQLMGFSRALLQETKELEAIKDMLLQKLEEQKELLRRTEEDFEFTQKKLNTEKNNTKEHLDLIAQLQQQTKHDELEIQSLTQHSGELETVYDELQKKQKNTEAKLVLLAKEVKTLRSRNKEHEEFTSLMHSGMLSARRIFDELRI